MFSYLGHDCTALKINFNQLDGINNVFFPGREETLQILIVLEAILDGGGGGNSLLFPELDGVTCC